MRNHQPIIALMLVVICYCLPAGAVTGKHSSPKNTHPTGNQVSKISLEHEYGDIDLAFEPNQGQAPADVRFISRAQGMTVLLKDDEATLVTATDKNQAKVHMKFVGASFANPPYALDQQAGTSNYITGSIPDQWHTEIPNFGRVRYAGVYPGIDLVLYGNHRRLEHDFVVAPGTDYRKIAVKLEGATRLVVEGSGELRVETASGNFVFQAPEVYQYRGAKRVTVSGKYALTAANEFTFLLGQFDHALPLVIDPVLSYSTYLAGSSTDIANAIAIDNNGNAYVTGYTYSIDFPLLGAEQGTCANICATGDVFVTKLNTTGSALVYSTFVGGTGSDRGAAIAVDSLGYASVAGTTESFDFPQKNGMTAILSTNSTHGFVFTLSPTGSALSFSSYLGGEAYDLATGVATDSSGNVYAAGLTSSTIFPVTPGNQIGPPPSNSNDVFLVKFSRTGTLAFSTLIGGSSLSYPGTFPFQQGIPVSVAVDAAGEAVLAGIATDGFPGTAGTYQADFPGVVTGVQSAFVAKLNATGSALLYGTYLSGPNGAAATHLTLDSSGNIYVTGYTSATDFPTTAGAFQTENIQGQYQGVGFVSKLDPTLSTLIYSTYLGGTQAGTSGGTGPTGLAVDANGNAFVAGTTNQPLFPLVSPVMGSLAQGTFGSISGGFLSVLNPSGSALVFSTFFSGSTNTNVNAVALGLAGNPYLTGFTLDSDLPVTSGAFQRTFPVTPYTQHAFVTKFLMGTANAAACFPSGTLYFGTVLPGQSSLDIPLTLTNCGTLPLKVSSVSASTSAFTVTQNGCTTVAAGASCVIKVRFSPSVADGTDTATLKVNDNAPVTPQIIQLSGYSAVPNIFIYNPNLGAPDGVVGVKGFPVLTQIQNSYLAPLHISKVTITGDFALVNQCPKVLDLGQGCTIGATFTPKAAGLRTGTISIYDDGYGSPQTISIQGTAVAKYPTPVLTFVSPGAALVGSGPVALVIEGTGIFPTSKVTLNGVSVPINTAYAPELLVTIPASLLSTFGNIVVQVVNPAPGGASAPFNFAVYKQVSLSAVDAVYEPFTRKFYASIPARSATNPNSLVSIDPVTFAVGTPIAIGNDPGALGLSTDGTTLYVALNGDNSVVSFNVVTQKIGVPIPLGSDPQKGLFNASNIQVQPDHAANFVATLTTPAYGPDGLAWIKNGKVVTQFLNEPPTNEAVGGTQFVGTNDVYAWSAYYGNTGIEHFVVSGNTLLEAPGFTAQYGVGPFDNDGKNLFDVNGQVFQASTGAVIGNLAGIDGPGINGILTEQNSGRTFLIGQFGAISAYDSTTFSLLGITNFQIGYNPPNRLQHWGANGLSFLANNFSGDTYDLYLFRTPLLYPAVGPNPLPVLTSVSPSPVTSKGSNFLLTVNGSKFIRGAVVQWNGVTRTTKWISATKLTADIQASEIKAAGSAKITVVNPGPGGGASSTLTLTIK